MNLNHIIAQRPTKTIYRDGDKAIKVYQAGYSKADVLNEALNQARVEETGLNIPKIEAVTMVEGQWAIVSSFIEGKTLAAIMAAHPGEQERYLNWFVDIQLEMHRKKSPLLNKLYDKMEGKIHQTNLNASTRYDLHTRLSAMPKHNKLCHGDFNPSNIIITPQNEPYVLDWSHATQGNASADAARTYLLFSLRGDTQGAAQYLKLFSEKSDTAVQYIQQWLPIVAASQLVKEREGEAAFLMKWINVFDYE